MVGGTAGSAMSASTSRCQCHVPPLAAPCMDVRSKVLVLKKIQTVSNLKIVLKSVKNKKSQLQDPWPGA
jgi:hypothetical protein